MAETVWKELKATDSATCRSCHSFDAMDIASQSESAQKMHNKAQKGGETCIDCHKGIAHFPPEIKMDDNAAHELESQAATSVTNGAHIYPFKTSRIGELATVNPGTDLTVVDASGKQPIVLLQGYQMQGSENTLYLASGQRLALATLSEEGIKALTVNGEWQADEYGNQWRQASLQGALTDPALADRKPLWQYAEKLDDTYCRRPLHRQCVAVHCQRNGGTNQHERKRTGHFDAVLPVQRQRYYRETVILVDQGGSYDINKT
ncbi:cytochrome c-type protein torY [Shigella boydii 5216-82]|nr:cytochrome c-type protein torY [Shigella boydii 5216-82]